MRWLLCLLLLVTYTQASDAAKEMAEVAVGNGKYFTSAQGQYCPSGQDPTSEQACQTAASAQGIPWGSSYNGPGQWHACIYATDGRSNAHWNWGAGSSWPPHSSFASICEKPTIPCAWGSTWSATGNEPCMACQTCEFGVLTACTTTRDNICGYDPECKPQQGYECHEGVCNTQTDQGTDFNEGGCIDVESRAECVTACNDDPDCTMYEFTGDSHPDYSSPRCCLEHCDLNHCTNFDFQCSSPNGNDWSWDLYVREETHNDCFFCSSYGDPHIINFHKEIADNHVEGELVLLEYGTFKVIATQARIPWNVALNTDVRIENNGEVIFTYDRYCNYEIKNPDALEFIALLTDSTLDDKRHGMSRSYWPTNIPPVLWDYMIKLPDASDALSIFFSCASDERYYKWANVGIKHCGELAETSGYCADEKEETQRSRLLMLTDICDNLSGCCNKYIESGQWDLWDACQTDNWFECCDIESGNRFSRDDTCCDNWIPSCELDPAVCSPGEECDTNDGTCKPVVTPDDCEGKWSDFTACSADGCGVGEQTRTFTVLQEGTEGGAVCPEDDQGEHVVKCMDYSDCPPIHLCAAYGDVHFMLFNGAVDNQAVGSMLLFGNDRVKIMEQQTGVPGKGVSVNTRAWATFDGQTVASVDIGSCNMQSTDTEKAIVQGSDPNLWPPGQHPGHFQWMVTFPEQDDIIAFFSCNHEWGPSVYINVGIKFMGNGGSGLCVGWGVSSEAAVSKEAVLQSSVVHQETSERSIGIVTATDDEPTDLIELNQDNFIVPDPDNMPSCFLLDQCCNNFISDEAMYNGCLVDAEFLCCVEGADEDCCGFFVDGRCDEDFECGFKECCDHETGLCNDCTPCVDGENYNDLSGFEPCTPCSVCASDTIQECVRYSNTACEECNDDDLCLQGSEGYFPGDLCMTHGDSCDVAAVSTCCMATCGLCAEYNPKGVCMAPENVETIEAGKECPDEGGCLDGVAYIELDESWHACSLSPECAYVYSNAEGQFLLFRESDPDVLAAEGAFLYVYNCNCVEGENWSINGEVPCAPCQTCDEYDSECTTTADAVCKNQCTNGAWSETGFSPCTGCTQCEAYSQECTSDTDGVCGEKPPYFTIDTGSCDAPLTTYDDCEAANVYLELYKKGTRAAKMDPQNGATWDPPYCYVENGKVKFNDGTNVGPCKPKDLCVCAQPEEFSIAAMLHLSEEFSTIQVVGLGLLCFGFGCFVKIWTHRKDEATAYLLVKDEF